MNNLNKMIRAMTVGEPHYTFDPETMYQPQLPPVDHVDDYGGFVRYHRDGRVTQEAGVETGITIEQRETERYNCYVFGAKRFHAYKRAFLKLFPERPRELTQVDHIDRDNKNDAWDNLRWVSASLNNLNQYRKATKGYDHETDEWLQKMNGYRVKKGLKPLRLKPRNKYIARIIYKGTRYEQGIFDTPEEATRCYNDSKERFVRERLTEMWTDFLAAR